MLKHLGYSILLTIDFDSWFRAASPQANYQPIEPRAKSLIINY